MPPVADQSKPVAEGKNRDEQAEKVEEEIAEVILSEHDEKFKNYVEFCKTYQINFLLANRIQHLLLENQEQTNKLTRLEVRALYS